VPDVVLVTLGTGLGGGIILGGRLFRGGFGVAAEFGHLRRVPGGLPCGCGNHGCWEQYTSGTALVRQARAAAADDPRAAATLLELAGGQVTGIDGRSVTSAAEHGDPLAVRLLTELGRTLGEGIADLASVLDPALVVVGGGVADAGDLVLAPARTAFAAALSGASHRPLLRIVAAELGNDAGLVGVADLARHR
jgi:glucokinase